MRDSSKSLRIVHLPYYDDNPYQDLLMEVQRKLGHHVQSGGSGGYFLRTALKVWKPDLLHFHWIHPYLLKDSRLGSVVRSIRLLIECGILRLRGIQLAWTIHNLKNHDNRHVRIERLFSALFCRVVRTLIAHSSEAARLAEKRFWLRKGTVSVIPHPSYVGQYPDTISREDARLKLDIEPDSKVFLFLGRIHPYKGVFDLIEAFSDLPKEAVLVIAGLPNSDETAQRLEQAASKDPRIRVFAERIPDEDLQIYFRAADVTVIPYRQILTSGATILAMSFGSFVIAPDVPTLRETLHPEGAAFFEIANVKALKGAMENFLISDCNPDGAVNFERAKDWTWALTAGRIGEKYSRES